MDTQELIRYCTKQLPDNMRSRPWEATNHGRAILQTEDQLNAYIAAYGEMHFIKCRAALQNFPFKDLTNYEIVDWGCGQGIASLTLYDMLREHNKAYGLKRITLIEPSEPALRRAEAFVKRAIDQRIEVIAINKSIPSSEDSNELSEVTSSIPVAIHLFSNILDIRSLSLKWLAKKVASYTKQQFIVSVGPAMRGESRISDFAEFFPDKDVFSKIYQYPYAYTETHHPFGCETMCFFVSSSDINENYVEKADSPIFIDDYSYVAESLRGIVNDDIINAYNAIRAKMEESDSIFIRPHISTDIPDIVLVRPKVGVLFFNVCSNVQDAEAELERIKVYRWNVYNIHLKDILSKTLLDGRYNSLIKQAIYFPTETEEPSVVGDHTYVPFVMKGGVSSDTFFDDVDMVRQRGIFGNTLYESFINLIKGDGWHSYKDGDENIKPIGKQREFSISGIRTKTGYKNQKITGVAGSGKTQVLAWRAVNAQVRTGGRVLILTFNITLRNFIRYRIGRVAADFNWDQFTITNYHQFFKSQAHNHHLKPQLGDWDDPQYFENCKNYTERYDAVLFDEAQDYKEVWFSIVKKYFLVEGGEIVVFGDGRQNIYGRKQDNEHMPYTPLGDKWSHLNEERRISHRTENPEIARLASAFQENFFDYSEPIEAQQALPYERFYIKYWIVSRNVPVETLNDGIRSILQYPDLEKRDVTVLSQSCNVLRNVEECYSRYGGGMPITTFEKKSEFEAIMRREQWPKTYIDSIRRVKKIHFTMDYNNIKMATIHSFKGWESPTVILILQPEGSIDDDANNVIEQENSPALIYTAITRAKRNLFIINMGNEKYHDFFTNNITL